MNGKQLKNSILQWAIQGKLVPQDPNDEPASVLLERIREEKARLVKEGKIKKDKNESIIFRGDDNSHYEKFLATGEVKCIDDEIPFEIPEGWEWCRLGMLFSHCTGKALNGINKKGKLYTYITTSNLYWDRFEMSTLKEMYFTDEELDKCTAIKGDLLVCEGGDIGRSAIWNYDYDIRIQNHIHKLRAYLPLCTRFFYYVMFLYKGIGNIGGKGIGIQGLSSGALHNIILPLPPISEQERIIAQIETIMPLAAKYEKSQDELNRLNDDIYTRLRKSILQEAIQGKLVPQDPNDEPASVLLERIREEKQRLLKEGKLKKKDITDSVIFKGEDNKYFEKIGNDILCLEDEMLFDIPDKWMWTRLSTIANLYTGNSISETDKKQKYTNVYGLEYIGTKDVGFDHLINYSNGVAIPLQHIENFKIAPSHSVLLCIEGGSAGRKIARLQKDVCFGNKLCCLSPYFVSLSEYIYYYLQSPAFFESFQGNIAGIIGGVSVNTLKSLLIPLPPIEEIKRITIRLQEVLSSIMSR